MGKFVIQKTATGYRFELLASNGQDIASSEVYETRAACIKGIQSVIKCASKAKLADLTEDEKPVTNPKFELFQDKSGEYRFRLRSRNGAIIAASDGYSTKAACENGIESVRLNVADAQIEE